MTDTEIKKRLLKQKYMQCILRKGARISEIDDDYLSRMGKNGKLILPKHRKKKEQRYFTQRN